MGNKERYGDELDRMRKRQQQRKQGASRTKIASHSSERTSGSTRSSAASKASRHTSSQSGHARRKKKRGIIPIFILLLVIALGMLLMRRATGEGYWTIAVFGVDSRDGKLEKGALSDVEMLCSINRKTGEIRLVSVFRDSYLRIDSEGSYDKINEAYFLGGHEQAIDALRDNFNIAIDDYATFNWKAVVDAINVLGGVDIEITDKEFAYINSFITETVNATGVGSVQLEHSGANHLDGVQAVAYARLRLMDTDFTRTERQRKILGQVMEKAKAADFGTLRTLVGAVFPQISTSIGVDDLLAVAKDAKRYYIGQTSGFPFSHSEMNIGKKSCVIPTTLESNVIQLHAFLYDDTQYMPSDTVLKISSHIAEVSGLGTPGKDTESGKNVGAQGNTGSSGNSAPSETSASQTEPPANAADGNANAGQESNTQENNSDNNGDNSDSGNNGNGASEEDPSNYEDSSSEDSSSEQDSGSLEDAIEIPEPDNNTPAQGPGTSGPSGSQSPGTNDSSANGPGQTNPSSGSGNSESSVPSGNGSSTGLSAGPGTDSSNTALTGPGQSEGSSVQSGTALEAPGQSGPGTTETAGPGA